MGKTDQQENNNKHLFGVYLNQARLNAFITLSHISDLVNAGEVKEESLSEAAVLNSLDKWKDPIKSRRVYDLINEHFPMLDKIFNKTKRRTKAEEGTVDMTVRAVEYKKILQTFLKAIHAKRNQCCHVESTDTLADKVDVSELIRYLDDCFDASVDQVKTRLSLFEDDQSKNNPKDECLHLRRFKRVEKVDGKRKTKANPFFQYFFKDKDGSLTGKGLAFLICLFLDKDDSFKFLKSCGLPGFKKDTDNRSRATLLSYCVWSLRLPYPKVRSDEDITGLALDMLGDLGKCPRELFGLLSREKQEIFRREEKTESDEDGREILQMRYSDRFAKLALRYCDEQKVFQNIRFQIKLGKYYFKFYPKTAVNGVNYQRKLDKNLRTFGRLKDVREMIKLDWESKGIVKEPNQIDEGYDQPYVRKTAPDYNIVDNQICLAISHKTALPELKVEKGQERKNNKPPQAWLSVHQLPAMLFHGLSLGFDKTEDLIKSYITGQRDILKTVAQTVVDTDEMKSNPFFPDALLPQKDKESGSYEKQKLKRMQQETKDLKKKFIDIKAGKLADFLARDIIRLQPFDVAKEGNKGKTTALNFQALQEAIALFGAKKHSLSRIFKELGLTDGDFQHPFLTALGDPVSYCSIIDFYKSYLNKRQEYLNSLNLSQLSSLQFLRPSRQRYVSADRSLQTIACQLQDKPVNIPSNLFKNDIKTFVLGQLPQIKTDRMNNAYLIQEYFKLKEGNHQPMYGYEKTYPIVQKAAEYRKKRRNKNISDILGEITNQMGYKEMKDMVKDIPQGRYEPNTLRKNLLKGVREFKENERDLRRIKVQDAIVFLMLKDILKGTLGAQVSDSAVEAEQIEVTADCPENPLANPARELLALKLENIDPDTDRQGGDSIFQHPMPPCETDISFDFNSNVNYEKDYVSYMDYKYQDCSGYTISDSKREVTYKFILSNVKLKDIGKHRRFFKDRRLAGLLSWLYMPGDRIDCMEIEKEVDAFKQKRIPIAQKLTELETAAIRKYNLQPQGKENYVPFKKVVETIQINLPALKQQCLTVGKIRNAMNHNQFPAFRQEIMDSAGDTIAEKMFNITETLVNYIIEQINK